MASTKEYLEYILEQLGETEGISYRSMMGEYLLYLKGKLFGGIYDNRLLMKETKAGRALLPTACMEPPYAGAKRMLLVENLEEKGFLKRLIEATAAELPEPKKKS